MSRRAQRIFREAAVLVTAALSVLSARASLADHYHVPSGSMLPTVGIGDRILVNKLAYGVRFPFTDLYLYESSPPSRGDVVVLDAPDEDRVLLKRVVAGPGDRVAVIGGRLFLNGSSVPIQARRGALIERLGSVGHEVWLSNGGGRALPPIEIPSDQFLVLGDNRGESRDGRVFGLVDRSAILGQAWGIYFSDSSFVWRSL